MDCRAPARVAVERRAGVVEKAEALDPENRADHAGKGGRDPPPAQVQHGEELLVGQEHHIRMNVNEPLENGRPGEGEAARVRNGPAVGREVGPGKDGIRGGEVQPVIVDQPN